MARELSRGRVVAVLAVCGMLVQVAGGIPVTAASAARVVSAASGGPLLAGGAASASALAASSGQPVEVLADRTDWSQTFADPGGGFTADESVVPVRVQEPDGSWVPVDTTLSVRPDGLVSPGAVVPVLTMSGGGGGPLYTLAAGSGGSVSVSWPYGPLPAPSLSGSTASYLSVLPGVNLLLTATPTGVQELLQVMSAAAAANPELAKITFPVSAPGLSLSSDGNGGAVVADSSGNAMFTAAPAQMWDSAAVASTAVGATAGTGAVSGLAPSAPGLVSPQPGDHMGVSAMTTAAGSLSLSPAATVLGGSSTVYPVYIDPDFSSATQNSWLDVARDFASPTDYWGDWEYTDPAGGIRSGVECDPSFSNGNCVDPTPDRTWAIYRSYLNFAVPAGIGGASYVDAKLDVNEVDSWSCNASTVELWQTAVATQSMIWTNRPSEQTWQDSASAANGWSGTSAPCPAKGITLNATSALTQAAAGNGSTVTLELRASLSDEQASPPVVNSWKRFQATGDCATGAPCLQVFWLHPPDAPTQSAVSTRGTFDPATGATVADCASRQGFPDYVNTNVPVWQAKVNDPDQLNIDGEFAWTNVTTGTTGTLAANGNPAGSGTVFTGQRSGTPGDEYQWQAYGATPSKLDPLSGNTVNPITGARSNPPCYVTIDTVKPAGTVAVTSNVYQNGVPSGSVGTPGIFTFSDPDYSGSDSDVVGYLYGIDSSQPSVYVPATNGTATITLAPYTSSQENLYVQAVDHAGNLGPLNMSGSTAVPSFVLIPGATLPNVSTLGYWKLNGSSADSSGKGSSVTLATGAAYPCAGADPPGYTCSLAGEADTSRPVVSNQAGYTVSAWVNASGCVQYCVAMSEDASSVSAFTLAYQASCPASSGGCWDFSMNLTDSQTSTLDTAQAPAAQSQAGQWVQLTGVFNPLQVVGSHRGTLTLYVNGAQAAQFVGVPIWSTTPSGVLRMGAGFGGATPWAGDLSDACVFYGALSSAPVPPQTTSDIQSLYDHGSGDGCAVLDGLYP